MYIIIFFVEARQSRNQTPQALLPAVGRQERLWGTGILLPQDFCGKTVQAIAGQPIKKFKYNSSFPGLSGRLSACQRA